MTMSEAERFPAGTALYHCPLCDWTHTELPASETELISSLGDPVLDVAKRRAMAVEVQVASHLSTHPLAEWVAEVTRLRAEMNSLRRVVTAAEEWNDFISAAAAMSYVLDAAELERRERKAEEALRDAVADRR